MQVAFFMFKFIIYLVFLKAAMKFHFLLPILIFNGVNLAGAQQLKLENLGAKINSAYSELNPIISVDGKTLYFIRSGHPQNKGGLNGSQDIWISKSIDSITWEEAQRAPDELNRTNYNTLWNVSPDGNHLLIGGAYDDQLFWGVGFSLISRANNQWLPAKYLEIKKFDKICLGEFSSACMGADNKLLIISFSEKEGSTINNLYISFLQNNGAWSEPMSLGKDVNTEFDESTPFLAADGMTLYFSSDRPGGIGQHDIYMTRRLDESWQKWSVPVNLGKPINSEVKEGFYTLPASGDVAYLVSNHQSLGKADIFRVRTTAETRPEPVVLVKGRVYNSKTKTPVEATITYEELPSGQIAGSANFQSDGEYNLVLRYGKNYGIIAKSNGYIPISVNIDLQKDNAYEERRIDLEMVPIEKGLTIRINNLFFNTGKWELKEESTPEMERLVEFMKQNKKVRIEISGHTDDIGQEADNLALSENRAKAVYDYLVSKGVSSNRLLSKGFGEGKPLFENSTEENRQLNRRVEFKILE